MRAILFLYLLYTAFAADADGVAETQPKGKDTCKDLKQLFKKQHFFTLAERTTYCEGKCDFLKKYNCADEFGLPKIPFITDVISWFNKTGTEMTKGVLEVKETASWIKMPADGYVLKRSFEFLFPYLLTLIPMTLTRLADKGTAAALCLVFGVAMTFGFYTAPLALLHAWIYAYICAVSTVSSKIMQDLIVSYLVLIVLMFCAVTTLDMILQTVIGFAALLIIGSTFWKALNSRSETNRMAILVGLLQICVTANFLRYVVSQFAVGSFSVAMLGYGMDAMLGLGRFRSLHSNALDSLVFLIDHCEFSNSIKLMIFFFGYPSFFIVYLLTRAVIGTVVLSTLNFKFEISVLSWGLYSYMIDIVSPFVTLLNYLFDSSALRHRKVFYAILMSVLMGFELAYAAEIVVMRLCLYALDVTVFQTGLGGATKFLDYEFNCNGMAFPKMGAFPFFCLDTLHSIRTHVVHLTADACTSTGAIMKSVRGVGLVRMDPRGMAEILTARHVLLDSTKVRIDDQEYKTEATKTMGTSADPVMAMRLPLRTNGANLSYLLPEEKTFVKFLAVLNPDGPCGIIDKFVFTQANDIEATVNLMQGDSGSPVIAVMSDGTVRYAGAVSRGTFAEGTGNYISSVISEGIMKGSPGLDSAYYDVENTNSATDARILAKLNELMNENGLHFQEFMSSLEDWGRRKDQDPDAWPDEFKQQHSDKIRNWKKNQAYQRRRSAFTALVESSSMAQHAREHAITVFEAGQLVMLNARRQEIRRGTGVGFNPGLWRSAGGTDGFSLGQQDREGIGLQGTGHGLGYDPGPQSAG